MTWRTCIRLALLGQQHLLGSKPALYLLQAALTVMMLLLVLLLLMLLLLLVPPTLLMVVVVVVHPLLLRRGTFRCVSLTCQPHDPSNQHRMT